MNDYLGFKMKFWNCFEFSLKGKADLRTQPLPLSTVSKINFPGIFNLKWLFLFYIGSTYRAFIFDNKPFFDTVVVEVMITWKFQQHIALLEIHHTNSARFVLMISVLRFHTVSYCMVTSSYTIWIIWLMAYRKLWFMAYRNLHILLCSLCWISRNIFLGSRFIWAACIGFLIGDTDNSGIRTDVGVVASMRKPVTDATPVTIFVAHLSRPCSEFWFLSQQRLRRTIWHHLWAVATTTTKIKMLIMITTSISTGKLWNSLDALCFFEF